MGYVQLPTPSDLDIIGAIRFSKRDNQLLVSSWDNKLILYDINESEPAPKPIIAANFVSKSPILSIEYGTNSNNAFLGALDGSIRHIDYENMKISTESLTKVPGEGISHGINNLTTIEGKDNILVATLFNGDIKYIDTRVSRPVHEKSTGKKIFAMDTTSQFVCAGMASRQIEIYDNRNWSQPYQIRESGLKYQMKDLQCFPTGEGYAISSIDGRVSMEYFDTSPEVQVQKFAFKCHRTTNKTTHEDEVFPVNCIRFSSIHNVLYTAGSDGHVCLWNWQKRKRTKQYPKFDNPRPVTHIDLNHGEEILAVATSDDSYKNRSDFTQVVDPSPSKVYIKLPDRPES